MKEKLLEFLRDKKRRLFCSVLAGMAACVIAAGVQGQQGVLAWWGTLYPEFCFSKTEEPDEEEEEMRDERPRISFWLAKALNW